MLAIVVAWTPAGAWAQPACTGTATLTVLVRNLGSDPAVQVTVDGELAADGVPCTGTGAESYREVLTCVGTGLVRCGRVADLRPGSWVHRVSLTVAGSPTQQQAQRLALVGVDSTPASNAIVWTAYPKTFVVDSTDGDALWTTIEAAAEYTRCNPGPALVTFSPAVFPGAGDPRRIHLLPPAPSCRISDRNLCTPPLTPGACTVDGKPDGHSAGLCLTGDRIVIDALDGDANAGGVILSVDACAKQVMRVYGSDDVLRGLVLEGSRAPNPRAPCQVDTVAFTGPAAQRNRIEHALVVGPTCGDAVSVDGQAGVSDDAGDAGIEIVDSRITGASDKGVRVESGGVALVARSCVHDNRDGGIQARLGGAVAAVENVVQRNLPGAAQHGLSVTGSTDRSRMATDGNVVRFAGGRGLSVSNNAEAVFQNDYVADSQFAGAKVETTSAAAADAVPSATFHGVALVCNRHENLTGTCSPSDGVVEEPCSTVDDCCLGANGALDPACVSASACLPGSFPRGYGVSVVRAADRSSPSVRFGEGTLPGRNAFSTNKNTAAGSNFRIAGVDDTIPAVGNQWQHCGTGSVCDASAVLAQDVSPPDASVDVGVPPGPRAGAPALTRITPPRPVAGRIVRVYGDDFNAIEGNPLDDGSATPNCGDFVPCAPDGACPTGPCIGGACPCAIENALVQRRNMQTGANRIRIKRRDGTILATLYPDAVTPTMLAFRMPFDCFAPLTLEVAKRDPSGNRIPATTSLCDPSGCTDAPADTPCDDGDACTVDDHCDGAGRCVGAGVVDCGGACMACDHQIGCVRRPAGAICRAAASACDVAERCDGVDDACPPDAIADVAAVCRPPAGPCDVAEICDGISKACPANRLAPTSTVCRPAVDSCDLDDSCTGSSPACPAFDNVKTGFDAVTCAFERSVDPPACASQPVPRKIARLFGQAGREVLAPSGNPRTAKAHLCGARRKLARALALVDKAVHRRAHLLSGACAAELRRVVGDAARRIDGTGVACRR